MADRGTTKYRGTVDGSRKSTRKKKNDLIGVLGPEQSSKLSKYTSIHKNAHISTTAAAVMTRKKLFERSRRGQRES